jgi:hypothetical protein
MKKIHVIGISLIAIFLIGCRKSSSSEHQEFINLAMSVEKCSQIHSKNQKIGAVLTGVYGAAVPPDIFLNLYYDKKISKNDQQEITSLIYEKKRNLDISRRVKIKYLTGNNISNTTFGRAEIK